MKTILSFLLIFSGVVCASSTTRSNFVCGPFADPSVVNYSKGVCSIAGRGGSSSSETPAPAFTPTDFSNLTLWLDGSTNAASNFTLVSTDHVSVWKDKSGGGRDFSEGTDANRPIWTPNVKNGLGAPLFNASKKLANAASVFVATTTTPFTMVNVVKLEAYGATNWSYVGILNFGEATLFSMMYRVADSNGPRWGNKASGSYAAIESSSALANQTSWHYLTLTYDGVDPAANGSYTMYFDGVAQTVAGSFSDSGSGTASVLGQYQNSVADPDYGWNGYQAEHIIYNQKLSAQNLATLHSYIATKWGF